MRRLDLREATLPATRVSDRYHGRAPHAVDRNSTRLLAAALKALLYVAVLLWVDVAMAGAPVLPLVVAALGTALALGKLVAFSDAAERLDVARWRTEGGAHRVAVTPGWRTTMRVVVSNPVATSAFAATPLLADAALGGWGVLPGVFAGLVLAVAASRVVDATLLSHWQDQSGELLHIDGGSDPIRRHRFLSRPN